MHISGIKRMYPQYPNKASNLTYPRKEKKNDGDFKEVLDLLAHCTENSVTAAIEYE